MTKSNNLQFQTYLQSISDKYKCWWNLYTLTDVEGKKSPFDFNLMVQSVQPKQEQEKIKRLPVLSGIRKYADKHVLLIGKPGSGKSTALQRLLWEDARAIIQGENRIIPVLVELRNWNTSVETLIYKFLRSNKHRIDISKIEDLLFEGDLLLLMDGLNELPSDEARDNVARFRRDYSETPMIFTTRNLGVGGDLGIDKQLEMQPLTETQMRKFVHKYLPQQGDHMLQQLANRLRELGETPLILKILCDVFKLDGKIPKSRGELFRQFDNKVNHFKEDEETVPIPERLRSWKGELLQYLAFVMMQSENPQADSTNFRLSISRSQTEAILEDFLKDRIEFPGQKAKEWLDGLLKHCLVENKASESEQVVIQFHHQLFQEYYAAVYLLRLLPNLSNEKLKRDYLNLLKWTEPVALMLALVEDEAQALRVVRLALKVDLILGARLVGEVKPEFQQQPIDWILGKKLPKLLETQLLDISRSDCAVDALINALNHEYSDVRRRAADALGKIGSESAAYALINALNDEYSDVRMRAVYALGKIGSERAVDGLINALNHEDSSVRMRAAEALGEIGSERAVDGLINALNHEYLRVPGSAAKALGKISSERAVDALINALNHEDLSVRGSAAYALEKIGSERAVDALINALNHEDSYIRRGTAEALGEIGSERAVDALINALNHEDSSVRERAADALGRIGSERALDGLINALNHEGASNFGRNIILWLQKPCSILGLKKYICQKWWMLPNDEDLSVHRKVANALVRIGSKRAFDALINALNHEDSYVCWSAADALGEIGSEKAVNALINALNHEEFYVRGGAADALGKIGSESAFDALINSLNDKYPYVRKRAAYALGKVGSERAVDALINALNDEYSSVRERAADALEEIGSERAVDALINALNHEDSGVRRRAADALGKIGSEMAVDTLINALNDEDSDFCMSAEDALVKIGSERAVDALINALNDEDSYIHEIATIHEIAAEALGKIGSERAVDALINALNDEDINIHIIAVEVLGKIGSERAVDALINTLNHEDSGVRIRAVEALGKIGSERAVDALINALNDEYLYIHIIAVEALGKIGSERAVDALINALNDEYINIHGIAAEALGKIGSERAVDALINTLNNEDSSVRIRAVEALGKIGSERAVDALINALNHEDSYVHIRATYALEKIAGSDKIAQMWQSFLNGTSEAKDIILRIQEQYKFYNHEIFHSPPVEEQENNQNSKYNIKYAEIVQIIENNDGNVYGK